MAFRTHILTAVVALALLTPTLGSRFLAARCLMLGWRCSPFLETKSIVCKARTGAWQQSAECRDYGCQWCRWKVHQMHPICTSSRVRKVCKLGSIAEPSPVMETMMPVPMESPDMRMASPEPFVTETPMPEMETAEPAVEMLPMAETPAPVSASEGGECVYSGTDRVVMDMSTAAPGDGWTRSSFDGMSGLEFEATKRDGIVPAASQRKICFSVQMQESGQYYLTALTEAARNTENNDMWVSSSLGFELYRPGDIQRSGPGEYLKAYQNRGEGVLGDTLSTVDHDRHTFIVKDVRGGEPFEICLAGRSSMFEVYRVLLIQCDGKKDCTPDPMREKMGGKTSKEPTACV